MGLHPGVAGALAAMKNAELSRLVYRDNITVKHSSRKRLAEELDLKMKMAKSELQKAGGGPAILDEAAPDGEDDVMSKLLVDHLDCGASTVLVRVNCQCCPCQTKFNNQVPYLLNLICQVAITSV